MTEQPPQDPAVPASPPAQPPVTIADSRASIELLTAAYYSARTGEAVPLPIGLDHPYYHGWREAQGG